MHPTLIEFQRGAVLQTLVPRTLLEAVVPNPSPPLRYAPEHAEVRELLAERYRQELPFRSATQLSDAQSGLLYELVRELRPALVVETGIANGHSTVVLL
jgi:hypothetical protein